MNSKKTALVAIVFVAVLSFAAVAAVSFATSASAAETGQGNPGPASCAHEAVPGLGARDCGEGHHIVP